MKKAVFILLLMLTIGPRLGNGQELGNAGFSNSGAKARAEQSQRSKRVLAKEEMPPSDTSMFVEANVLMNVKADEFVAVFGIMQEGATPEACNQAMGATLQTFSDDLTSLDIRDADRFVDFVAQHKIYGFEVMGDIAREKLVGFELKKNMSVRYRDRSLLEKLVAAAARSQIFDLVKVDHVVNNSDRVQEQLSEEAARIVKQKTARYERLLGIKIRPPAQVFAERSGAYYPTELYDAYTAYSSEAAESAVSRQRLATQTARKSTTFYLNPLDADGFDSVINPSVIEPMVQFTLYLKVKYEVEQVPAK